MSVGRAAVVPSFDEIVLQVQGGGVIANRECYLPSGGLGAAPVEIGPGIRRRAAYDLCEKRNRSHRLFLSHASRRLPD
jgi:hypothetical protein